MRRSVRAAEAPPIVVTRPVLRLARAPEKAACPPRRRSPLFDRVDNEDAVLDQCDPTDGNRR